MTQIPNYGMRRFEKIEHRSGEKKCIQTFVHLRFFFLPQAYLRVFSEPENYLYLLNQDCFGCPYQLHENDNSENVQVLTLNTHHKWNFRIRSDNSDLLSQFTEDDFLICQVNDASLGKKIH